MSCQAGRGQQHRDRDDAQQKYDGGKERKIVASCPSPVHDITIRSW